LLASERSKRFTNFIFCRAGWYFLVSIIFTLRDCVYFNVFHVWCLGWTMGIYTREYHTDMWLVKLFDRKYYTLYIP
jgi:hypothetical protein